MTDMPERIWVHDPDLHDECGHWSETDYDCGTSYTRTDIADAQTVAAVEGAEKARADDMNAKLAMALDALHKVEATGYVRAVGIARAAIAKIGDGNE